jgi:hypothetical protein
VGTLPRCLLAVDWDQPAAGKRLLDEPVTARSGDCRAAMAVRIPHRSIGYGV